MARGEQNAVEKERETAESVRKRSMERLAERREKESQGCGKKRRKNDGDREAIDYFRGKYDREFNFKREELELRKREIEMKEQEKERQLEITKRETDMKEFQSMYSFVPIVNSSLVMLWLTYRPNSAIHKPPTVVQCSTFVVDSSCK